MASGGLLWLEGGIPALFERLTLIPQAKHEHADDDHGQGQQLSHGQRSEDESDMRIGLTKQFNDNPTEAIPRQETPKDGSRRGGPPANHPQHREQ